MLLVIDSKRCLPLLGLSFLLILSVVGCGGKEGQVSGKVTFDGTPVDDGRIQFRNKADGQAFSTGIKGGSYSLTCPPGEMAVEITASKIIPGKFDNSNGTPEPVGMMYIPAKYNSATTLTASVKSGGQTIPFDLTSR